MSKVMTRRQPQPLSKRLSAFGRRNLFVWLAFLVPLVLMCTAWGLMDVAPFGNADKQILVTDLWHQYYPFLVDMQHKLQHHESLFWTWSVGGGVNYFSLMSYYLASPLNFLSVFVHPDYLREFLAISVAVKISLAGAFMAYFLKSVFKRNDASLIIFGVSFSFCAFFMGYYWNTIWLDTVCITPLMALGAVKLLTENKFRLYTVMLALSLLTNYYMGFFSCIFVLLIFICYHLVRWQNFKVFAANFVKIGVFTILGIGIAAFFVLPAFSALQNTHASTLKFPEQFETNIGGSNDFLGVLNGLKSVTGNLVNFSVAANKEIDAMPNIACGAVPLFFAFLSLSSKEIKLKEKIVNFGLVLSLFLSFIIRQLDYVWHGFHFPNMIYYRFSYIVSFVLIVMGFHAFTKLKKVNVLEVIIAALLSFFTLSMEFDFTGSTDPEGKLDWMTPAVICSAIAIAVIVGAVVLNVTKAVKEKHSPAVISVSVIAVFTTLAAYIIYMLHQVQEVFPNNEVKEGEGPFDTGVFNMFAVKDHTRPDRMQWVVPTLIAVAVLFTLITALVVLYTKRIVPRQAVVASLLVIAVVQSGYTAYFGVNVTTVTGMFDYPRGEANTAAVIETMNDRETDTPELWRAEVTTTQTLNDGALNQYRGMSMFNSMANESITIFAQNFGMAGWQAGNRYLYLESSPVSNMFLNLKYLIARDGTYANTYDLNEVAASDKVKLLKNNHYLPMGFMVNKELLSWTEVKQENSFDQFEKQNEFFRYATGITEPVYTEISPKDNTTSASTDYIAPKSGLYLISGKSEKVKVKRNGNQQPQEHNLSTPYIACIGYFEKGDEITLVSEDEKQGDNVRLKLDVLNQDVFEKGYAMLSQNVMTTTEFNNGAKMKGTINTTRDGLFYTSVPYEKGWKAYVDGNEVEITPVGGSLVAFSLDKGSHTIELKYTPNGFAPGMVISVICLLAFAAACVLIYVLKKKLLPDWACDKAFQEEE